MGRRLHPVGTQILGVNSTSGMCNGERLVVGSSLIFQPSHCRGVYPGLGVNRRPKL